MDFKGSIKDGGRLKSLLNRKEAKYWVLLSMTLGIIYGVVSDGEFSFALTLSVCMQTFAVALLVLKIVSTRDVYGLSQDTLICLALVLVSRLSSTLFFEGYLPYDSSGDWLYQSLEVLCLALVLYTLRLSMKLKYDTGLNASVPWYILVAPCFALALVSHATLNAFFVTDVTITQVSWTFSMYLEGVAFLPQIMLVHRTNAEVFTSHYIAAYGCSRVLSVIFWLFSFNELNNAYRPLTVNLLAGYSGYFVIVAQVVQLLLVVDFLYYYVKSALTGAALSLPR